MKTPHLLITCEHASNAIPNAWKSWFRGKKNQSILKSHRGWDAGALELAQFLAKKKSVTLFAGSCSRLLIDLNRSLENKNLFSEFTETLESVQKKQLIDKIWLPHRQKVESYVSNLIGRKKKNEKANKKGDLLIHLAIHSFTPIYQDKIRKADLGFLYDPLRKGELDFCNQWISSIKKNSNLRVRRNYPYFGRTDGLCTSLRKQFSGEQYIGIEVECNQAWASKTGIRRTRIWNQIQDSLGETLKLFTDFV